MIATGAQCFNARGCRTFVRGLLLLCPVAGALLVASACGGHSTAPTPIVEQPAPQPVPQPPPPAPIPVLAVTRILAFGDSMTAGTTSPTLTSSLTAGLPESYPFKLQDLVTARYTGQTITVLNAGKPSEHVVDTATLGRFNHEVSDARPDLILLMEGANDLNDADEMVNATITTTVGTLEEMVKEAGRRRIPIMIATLPPQRLPKGRGAPFIGRFNDAVRVMAAKKGGILVDVNAGVPDALIGQDGLHPTEAGYQRIAETFLDAIKSAYESVPPQPVSR